MISINTLPQVGADSPTTPPRPTEPRIALPDVDLEARASTSHETRPRTAHLPQPPEIHSDAEDAPSLVQVATVVLPRAHLPTWEALQNRDPAAARCLSDMISNAFGAHASRDPLLAQMYQRHLRATLALIESEAKAQPAPQPFTDRVMTLAQEKAGIDDRAVLANLATHYRLEAIGLRAIQDIHLSQGDGVCHRAATKWAGCATVDAPFRYEDMNIDKINAKQGEFMKESLRKQEAVKKGWKFLKHLITGSEFAKADTKVAVRFSARWLQEFTDADGQVHRNAVTVAKPVISKPSKYLRKHPLQQGEALIVLLNVDRAGRRPLCHTVALSGGPQPRLFDSGAHTVFGVEGSAVGSSLEQFVRTQYASQGESIRWALVRVTANVPPSA